MRKSSLTVILLAAMIVLWGCQGSQGAMGSGPVRPAAAPVKVATNMDAEGGYRLHDQDVEDLGLEIVWTQKLYVNEKLVDAYVLGDLIIVDDDDERLTLRSSGSFVAEVVPENEAESGVWRKLDGPDDIVEFYDPTDVFGDLADTLAEAFPALAGPTDGEQDEGEQDDASDENAVDEAGAADGDKDGDDRR